MRKQRIAMKAAENIQELTARTRELNDIFRRDLLNPAHGDLFFTPAVAALRDDDRFALLDEVRCFEDFSENNDSYPEHDFGAVDFKGARYFWKIDYYDKTMRGHSPDKTNTSLTRRVLIIMRADEY
jgi:hypothetical protein